MAAHRVTAQRVTAQRVTAQRGAAHRVTAQRVTEATGAIQESYWRFSFSWKQRKNMSHRSRTFRVKRDYYI